MLAVGSVYSLRRCLLDFDANMLFSREYMKTKALCVIHCQFQIPLAPLSRHGTVLKLTKDRLLIPLFATKRGSYNTSAAAFPIHCCDLSGKFLRNRIETRLWAFSHVFVWMATQLPLDLDGL